MTAADPSRRIAHLDMDAFYASVELLRYPQLAGLPVVIGGRRRAEDDALAAAFDGEVVNVDSRQVYADIPIITAQPAPDERARCPHHLYGDTPLNRSVAAGDFAVRARAAAL